MTPEQELKDTIEKIGSAFEAFKSAHTDEVKDLRKGFDDVVKKDMFVKLNSTLDTLIEKKDALEKALDAEKKHTDEIEKKLNRLSLNGSPAAQETEQKNLAIFNGSLKSHAAALSRPLPPDATVEEMKAYSDGFRNFLRKGASSNPCRSSLRAML